MLPVKIYPCRSFSSLCHDDHVLQSVVSVIVWQQNLAMLLTEFIQVDAAALVLIVIGIGMHWGGGLVKL